MTIRRWTFVILVALLVITAAAAVVYAGREASAKSSAAASANLGPEASVAQQATSGTYRYVYSVKFVCGYQPPLVDQPGAPSRGEPVVKPGNYATEINIHNYNFRTAELRKKVVLLVRPSPDGKAQQVAREPRTVGPVIGDPGGIVWETVKLEQDFATLDDCNRFWEWTYPSAAIPVPFPLMTGYLVIYSPLDLDVDAVYTAAAPGTPGTASQGVSIDVERVAGKRVFVPATTTP